MARRRLRVLQRRRKKRLGGIGVQVANPPVEWNGCDSAIRMTGVDSDLGIHDDPDSIDTTTNLAGHNGFLYRTTVRYLMNRTVERIRSPRPLHPAHRRRAP